MRRRGAAVVLLLAALGWLVLAAVPAVADEGERITAYDVVLAVRGDGGLDVRETITYDFGAGERHGIFRTIPVRVPYDQDNDRVYDVSDVEVTSPSGAPADVDESESSGVLTVRVGDPDETITGRHVYVVTYRVDGALNAFPDHVELYWNAVGADWSVPIAAARVRVEAPGDVERYACFSGPVGSTLPCAAAAPTGPDAVEFSDDLAAYEALTVVVGLPASAVTATGPVLEERWTLRRAVTPTPLTGALAGLVLLPGLVGLGWLVVTRGRDRRYAGLTPGVLPAAGAPEEPAPLVGDPVAVQFAPPEGLRPGQVGTLLDEQANVLDVTATIVDLAVRGFLRIEEQPRRHWFSSRDWVLVRLAGTGELLPYERLLYDSLFEDADGQGRVALSSLKKKFAARLKKVQTALYEDVTAAGWFRGRPDKVRGLWQGAGFVLAFGGGWLTFGLSRFLHWAPVGIAVALLGAALFLLGRRMPARTARGSAVLAQARGFREYLRTAEAEQLRYEEGQDLFSRYLPYAVVFGEAERWVRVFGPLAASSASGGLAPGWYAGPNGWDANSFADSLDGFTSSAAGTLAASASSSGGSGFSGGSSGGGGGGGGGGSW